MRSSRLGRRLTEVALVAVTFVTGGSRSEVGTSADEARSPPAREVSEEAIRELAALGYVGAYEPAPQHAGVVVADLQRAEPGVNLVVSGHAPVASLLDMSGREVHSWHHQAPPGYGVAIERNFWRRVHLLPNGALLALLDPYGIIKLDRESRLVWSTDPALKLHHDLDVDGEGRIWALGKEARVIPRVHPTQPILDDVIIALDGGGRVLRRISIVDGLLRSAEGAEVLAWLVASTGEAARLGQPAHDALHVNTLQVFDGSEARRSPLFRRGNLLLCSPHTNDVFILDPDTERVIWRWRGPWSRIHEPQLVAGGTFVLFHNNGYKETDRWSELLEYRFDDHQQVWRYGGADGSAPRFFSGTSSTVARLANGNTLAVITESGRAIEVTRTGEIVWEYVNPARGGDGKLIAALFQLDRIAVDRVAGWIRELRRERRAVGSAPSTD